MKKNKWTKKILKDLARKDERIALLENQIKGITAQKRIHTHSFYDKVVKIGVVSDSHLGSLFERLDVLETAYDCFQRNDITHVYHVGDICDGEKIYRGHEYEIMIHGADQQAKHVIKNYPSRKEVTTYFITGNHDLSYWKNVGNDIGDRISHDRKDMIYLGQEEIDVSIGNGARQVKMRLFHPRKGTAYAISYRSQKAVESYAGGQKPQILIMGHTHKAEMLPCERNVFVIQAGTCQSQTKFMRGKEIAAHLGYWILEFTINEPKLVSRFKAEFFAMYEREESVVKI